MNIFLQIFMLILIVIMFFSVAGFIFIIAEEGDFNLGPICVLIATIVLFIMSYELLKFNVSLEYNSGNGYSNNLKLEYTVKNEVENHYNEDDFDLTYKVTHKIENASFWMDDYRISYDNIRVYIDREDDEIKVTYTCTENLKRTGIFTTKTNKAVYNTIKVSNKHKNNKENCPDKDKANDKTETDDGSSDKNENIAPKKE